MKKQFIYLLVSSLVILGCQSKSLNQQDAIAAKGKIESIKKVGLVVSYDCEIEKFFGKESDATEMVKCESHRITDPSLVSGDGPLAKFQADLLALFPNWEVKKISEIDSDHYLQNECTYKVLFFFDSVDLEKCFKDIDRRKKILADLGLDALIYQKIHLTSQLESTGAGIGEALSQSSGPRLLSYLYFDFRLYDKELKVPIWAQNEGFRQVSGDEDFFAAKAQYFMSTLGSGLENQLENKK